MDRPTGADHGQAIIEIILGMSVVVLIIAAGTHIAIKLKEQFKHDYVEVKNVAKPEVPMADVFKDKVIYFQKGSQTAQLESLKKSGWEIFKKLKGRQGPIYFLDRENRRMTLFSELGVITCTKNCETN